MTTAHKWTLGLCIALAVVLAWAGYGFVKEHEANAVLAVQQKDSKATQDAIAAKEQENQQSLAAALKSYAAMKQQVQTPQQVATALPALMPTMSSPVEQITPEAAKAYDEAQLPDVPKLNAGDIIIPAGDAKEFYDSQVDCKANGTKLTSCQETAANDQALIAAKDALIKDQSIALKGGTKWQRVRTAGKWLLIGAAAGFAVDEYHHR
jgi:hypothetical protein